MNDSLEVVKKLISDPIPYVNTGVFLGMTALDWELGMKVLLGLTSVVWTLLKIINEYKILREKSKTNTDK
jgi:hypothetical protein